MLTGHKLAREQVLSAMPFPYGFFSGHLSSIKQLLFRKVSGACSRLSRILYRWCSNSALHQSECWQCTYLWILHAETMILSLCVPIKQCYHDQLYFANWFLPIFHALWHHKWFQLVTHWPKWCMQIQIKWKWFFIFVAKAVLKVVVLTEIYWVPQWPSVGSCTK